jgi:hypothetical protein
VNNDKKCDLQWIKRYTHPGTFQISVLSYTYISNRALLHLPSPPSPVLHQTIERLSNKSSSFIGMILCYQSIFITLFIYEARSIYNKATRAAVFLALAIVQKMEFLIEQYKEI